MFKNSRYAPDLTLLYDDTISTRIYLVNVNFEDSRQTPEYWVVVIWPEESVYTIKFIPPKTRVRSAKSSACLKVESGIKTIERLALINRS